MSGTHAQGPAEWLGHLREGMQSLEGMVSPQCFGRLTEVHGFSLAARGCTGAVGSRCRIELDAQHCVDCEIVGFEDGKARLLAFDDTASLVPGAKVLPAHTPGQLRADGSLLGRVIDGLGRPLDGGTEPARERASERDHRQPNPLQRRAITQPLDVGVRAINALLTIGQGQRVGLFAPSGVGKSVLLGMMGRYTEADVVVVGLIGERGREVREFVEHNLGAEGLKKAVVVVAPAGSSSLLRARAAELMVEVAQSYTEQRRRVLLLMDSLTRFAEAHREIALAAGELPAARGFPPSVFSRLVALVERTGNLSRGTGIMSAVFTVLTQEEAEIDPVGEAAMAVLDGHLALSRELANQGQFPAIDVESSVSRVMNQITATDHRTRAGRFRQVLARYMQNRELITVGAYASGSDPQLDEAIERLPFLNAFLAQDQTEGVSLDESVKMLEQLLPLQPARPDDEANAVPVATPANAAPTAEQSAGRRTVASAAVGAQ